MIYVFNPEQDMALANFDINYMPPSAVRQFAVDFSVFPIWYAGADDMVLAPTAYNASFLEGLRGVFPHLPGIVTSIELPHFSSYSFSPWGWNPSLVARLSGYGVACSALPDNEALLRIRHCAHRLQAVKLLPLLQFKQCVGQSLYLSDLPALQQFVQARPAALLKAPLSGSGKGLNWCKGVFTTHIRDWCSQLIAKQGGVVAEPVYDKVEDFAMQFYTTGNGEASFCGYSLFRTTQSGAYMGNRLISDACVESVLAAYVPLETLYAVRAEVETYLGEMLTGVYKGYLGVDMMIVRNGQGAADAFALHPCVEINLRMNMGMASRCFFNNYVMPGSEGLFMVDYFSTNASLQAQHKQLTEQMPLVVKDGRIVEGYMPLVPVTAVAKYSAWVEVRRASTG